MSASVAASAAQSSGAAAPALDKHPRGLVVLFATEMWERFSFYTMLAMFTLYLQDGTQGFGWTRDRATGLYANYLALVYLSPLFGGWIADKKLGYRRSVMIGGLFFMAGHLLLAVRAVPVMYSALACLIVGNGFFKPNVSTMVGNLYPEGSHLKDRAYNIFYMGINIGAFMAPLVAEYVKGRFGFHPAFAVASLGMVISVLILWTFRRDVDDPQGLRARRGESATRTTSNHPIESISDSKRIGALIVIYLIVIVFWMVFHQNGSTLTYWANDNTNWRVSGVFSNAINPFFVITLTFPLVWFWKWLDKKGREPSTPTKIAFGMFLTALCYFIMFFAGKAGGDVGRVSPLWLIGAYFVITLGELMLSPMGLSLVSKVAPMRVRGLMMGGWFVATAIGNKLTMIGTLWDDMPHSSFFAMLGAMAFAMALILLFLLKPLKKAMPGV